MFNSRMQGRENYQREEVLFGLRNKKPEITGFRKEVIL